MPKTDAEIAAGEPDKLAYPVERRTRPEGRHTKPVWTDAQMRSVTGLEGVANLAAGESPALYTRKKRGGVNG